MKPFQLLSTIILLGYSIGAKAQFAALPAAEHWVDSVFATLTNEERIAQLMVIRTSAPGKDGKAILYNEQVDSLVLKYNVGGVCLFQGTPMEHAAMLNRIQSYAKTPIMVTVDGEWGLGMRFAGVQSFPYQLTMGATSDPELVYQVGKAIAEQCRRMNIHVNYAPVVDVNNNPNNPVIGYRSFGENREKVALYGTRIMQGMQDHGVMACAKHFPGHGDVDVDSHYDLPVINKSMAQLDSLELYPFKSLFSNGVGSVMIAHLYIPAIDATANRATSLSYNNVTKLMREQMGYQGLTFTDALEMKGVAKFFPSGEAAVQSIIAGNDMLCLPENVPQTIVTIKKAIEEGRLSWEQIYDKCRRVLLSKYAYVAGKTGEISMLNLSKELNQQITPLRKAVAEKALTVLKMDATWAPLAKTPQKVLHVQVGGKQKEALANALAGRKVTTLFVALNGDGIAAANAAVASGNYSRVIVSIQGLTRNPATRFGLSDAALQGLETLSKQAGATMVLLGNPYALGALQNTQFSTVAVAYEDDEIFQLAVYDWLTGLYNAEGTLPVSIAAYKAGDGIQSKTTLPYGNAEALGMNPEILRNIDEVAKEGILAEAYPGCAITVMRKGQVVYQQGFGFLTYEKVVPVTPNTIFDLASVTKISATTLSVMKLYEQGLLDINAPLGKYLPWLKNTDKANITLESMLLHQSGLVSFIPFFREVTQKSGAPSANLFTQTGADYYSVPVTDYLYMADRWRDTMYSRIKTSKLYDSLPRYVYSDNNFILLADVVKTITGKGVDQFASEQFYEPMGLNTTRFKVYEAFDKRQIAPTEIEQQFRRGMLWGYVHDPGAAMFGNVAGHAGLFSSATDLAMLYQMLLNGGTFNGKQWLKKSTIDLFTKTSSTISRRAYGFDKPSVQNDTLPVDKRYPAAYVSPATYGHTGYTGTCVWVDPKHELVYVFLSNRVHPEGGTNTKLASMNIRSRIQDIIYESFK